MSPLGPELYYSGVISQVSLQSLCVLNRLKEHYDSAVLSGNSGHVLNVLIGVSLRYSKHSEEQDIYQGIIDVTILVEWTEL